MSRIDDIAAGLAADWADLGTYRTLTGDEAPADAAEAYAIQRAFQAKMLYQRGPIGGRKIALTSRAMQEMVGFDSPAAGAIFAREIHASPAVIRLDRFVRLGLEFELAVKLARDVVPGEVHTPDSVRGLIASVHPAFELIEDRAADYGALDILTLIADNAWCGGIVLGDAIAGWEGLDLGNMEAVLHQDGHPPEPANTGSADPMGSLAWLLTHCGRQGETLRAGEVLITGSVLKTRFPGPGDRLRYEIIDHGAVEVELS